MNKFTIEKIIANFDKEPIEVKHADLHHLDAPDEYSFKRACPECENGVLPGQRAPVTLRMLPIDHCLLCGRRFIYTDYDEFKNY